MHIVIYGNSIVAKTLLLGLLQNTKHDITWLANAYTPVNRPIALSKSTIHLLTNLNVWNKIPHNYIQKIESMNLGNYENINLELKSYNTLQDELAYIISSKDLDNILDDSLSFMPRLNKINAKIIKTDYINNYDGKPKASVTYNIINDISSGQNKYNLSADIIICTQVDANCFNNSINPNYIEYNYKHKAITAVLASKNLHYGRAYQWFNKGNIMALLPMPAVNISSANNYALIWSVHNLDDKLNNLLNSLHDNCPQLSKIGIDNIIEYDGSTHKHVPLQLKIAKNLVHNNLVIIGDAAHRVHPLAGQGLNLGLRDVFELLSTLDNSFSVVTLKSKLLKYQTRRLIDMYKIAGITHAIYNLNNSDFGENLINFSLKTVNKMPFLQKAIVKFAN